MVVGLQLAPTTVIVEVELLLPPPQATSDTRQHTAAKIPKSRTPSPLLDLGDIHALRNHTRDIRAAVKFACVSALLKYKIRSFDGDRTVPVALLGSSRLFRTLKVGS